MAKGKFSEYIVALDNDVTSIIDGATVMSIYDLYTRMGLLVLCSMSFVSILVKIYMRNKKKIKEHNGQENMLIEVHNFDSENYHSVEI